MEGAGCEQRTLMAMFNVLGQVVRAWELLLMCALRTAHTHTLFCVCFIFQNKNWVFFKRERKTSVGDKRVTPLISEFSSTGSPHSAAGTPATRLDKGKPTDHVGPRKQRWCRVRGLTAPSEQGHPAADVGSFPPCIRAILALPQPDGTVRGGDENILYSMSHKY